MSNRRIAGPASIWWPGVRKSGHHGIAGGPPAPSSRLTAHGSRLLKPTSAERFIQRLPEVSHAAMDDRLSRRHRAEADGCHAFVMEAADRGRSPQQGESTRSLGHRTTSPPEHCPERGQLDRGHECDDQLPAGVVDAGQDALEGVGGQRDGTSCLSRQGDVPRGIAEDLSFPSQGTEERSQRRVDGAAGGRARCPSRPL